MLSLLCAKKILADNFFLPFSPLLELHLLEHGIVPLVVPELALVQVDDVRAHIVQKALVVGHCTQILKQNK